MGGVQPPLEAPVLSECCPTTLTRLLIRVRQNQTRIGAGIGRFDPHSCTCAIDMFDVQVSDVYGQCDICQCGSEHGVVHVCDGGHGAPGRS